MRIGGERDASTRRPRPPPHELRQDKQAERPNTNRPSSTAATDQARYRDGKANKDDGHGAKRPTAGNERNHGTHTEQRAARDDRTQVATPDDK